MNADDIAKQLESMVNKTDIQNLLNRLDMIEKQLKSANDERIMELRQLEKIDRSLQEITQKLNKSPLV